MAYPCSRRACSQPQRPGPHFAPSGHQGSQRQRSSAGGRAARQAKVGVWTHQATEFVAWLSRFRSTVSETGARVGDGLRGSVCWTSLNKMGLGGVRYEVGCCGCWSPWSPFVICQQRPRDSRGLAVGRGLCGAVPHPASAGRHCDHCGLERKRFEECGSFLYCFLFMHIIV